MFVSVRSGSSSSSLLSVSPLLLAVISGLQASSLPGQDCLEPDASRVSLRSLLAGKWTKPFGDLHRGEPVSSLKVYRIYECRISKLLFLRSLCGGHM